MITAAGFENPLIVASNELDEDLMADLKRQGAKINSWGVGTNLITASNAPALTGVYKLAAIFDQSGWKPRLKFSSNPAKMTDPGPRRIARFYDQADHPIGDVMFADGEEVRLNEDVIAVDRQHLFRRFHLKEAARFEVLAQLHVENGKRLIPPVPVSEIRARAKAQIATLPDEMKRLRNPEIYTVALSLKLAKVKEELIKEGY
jgi:nicotinate phosphoribosyltransferase